MIEVLFIFIFFVVSYSIAIGMMKIIDYYRYSKAYMIKDEIEKHFEKTCQENVDDIIELNNHEKVFLDELKLHLKCNSFPIDLNKKLKNIFCLTIKNPDKNLRKIAINISDDTYCSDKVNSLYSFLEEKFEHYIKLKNYSDEEINNLNFYLLGKEEMSEDEIIVYILNLNLYEFIKKFSTLHVVTKEVKGYDGDNPTNPKPT